MLICFLFIFNIVLGKTSDISNKLENKKELFLSNFYITINPDIHNQDSNNYYNNVIKWLLEIKQVLGILLKKYESNTENKIQLEKYRNIFFDCFCYIIIIKNFNIYPNNTINYNIFQYLQQKIFPCIKKINKIIKNTKDKIVIKMSYDIKNHIFSGLLRLKPLNLNNYVINIYLIENNEKPHIFIQSAKDFLFYLKILLQSIIEIGKSQIIPQDYKQIQNIINKLSKLMDNFAKLLLLESLNNINISSYKKEIEGLVQNLNEIFQRTHDISLYKTYKKFNGNINNNDNCMEYIPGIFHSKKKKYYQILSLNNEYFSIKKYKIQMDYENNQIEDIINVLKIVVKQNKNPAIREKIKGIIEAYGYQLEMEKKFLLRDKFVQDNLQKQKIEEDKKQKEKDEQNQARIIKIQQNKEQLKKVNNILMDKIKEEAKIKDSLSELINNKKIINNSYKEIQTKLNHNIIKTPEDLHKYPFIFQQTIQNLYDLDYKNQISELDELNFINYIGEEIHNDLKNEIKKQVEKKLSLENNIKEIDDYFNKNNKILEIINNEIENLEKKNQVIHKEINVLNEAINFKEEKPNINYQQQFYHQFNKIHQINTNENKSLYTDENSFYDFIDEVNYIIAHSDINIYYFYHYIYENQVLTPLVKDNINNYYVRYTDPETNKIFLQILLKHIKNNNQKIEINGLLKNLDNIIQKDKTIKNNNKIFSEIKKQEINLSTNNPLTNNYNPEIIKKYIIFTNRQLKKLNNLSYSYNLPSTINQNNLSSIQKIINDFSLKDLKNLQDNDIILVTLEKFKILQDIKKEYKKNFIDNYLAELININLKINNILEKSNLSTEELGVFIIDYNNYSFLYSDFILPLLAKK
jgi:hypothetical protein